MSVATPNDTANDTAAMPERFNGWKNEPTWLAALWFNRDQASQRHWESAAYDAYKATGDADAAAVALATTMKSYFTGVAPSLAGVFADLSPSAIETIGWVEIAKFFVGAVTNAADGIE